MGTSQKKVKFERKTALDVAEENYIGSLKNIITGMEVIKILKIKDNEYLVKCLREIT